MNDLIPRLERATGPDRELDGAIALATGWQHKETEDGRGISGEPIIKHTWTSPGGEEFWEKTTIFNRANKYPEELPHYTASLDAALTLVPEGYRWNVESSENGLLSHIKPVAGVAVDEAAAPSSDQFFAATPALALCIAALKAREENT